MVVKPAFSAGAFETRTYDFDAFAHMNDDYQQLLKSDDLLLQLFMEEILTQGEVSFVYFDKTFSHSVQKVPKEGDFRVQSLFEVPTIRIRPALRSWLKLSPLLMVFRNPFCMPG
ncbi:MAG: hypothetical protein IPK46_19520 [Saprospiraceae bacterium]|nr:hypothetical protein [Saprospiraceae bacterium]